MEGKTVRQALCYIAVALLAVGAMKAFDSYTLLKQDVETTESMLANQQLQLNRMRSQMIADKVYQREYRPIAQESLPPPSQPVEQIAAQAPLPVPLPLPLSVPVARSDVFLASSRPSRGPARPAIRLPTIRQQVPDEDAGVALADESKNDPGRPMMNVKLLVEK